MKPLTALILSDGRPGHYQRAEGIVAAIARLRRVETIRVTVHRRRWLPGRVLSALTGSGVPAARLLKLVYGIDAGTLPPADFVVSSGGDTLAANIAAATLLRATNIFYGGLRRFRPEDFSLVLTSYGPHAMRPRHRMVPLMPAPLDPDTLPLRSDAKPGSDSPPRVVGLMIGGDAGTFHYRSQDWKQLLAFVVATHEQHNTRWIVANSRRTPNEVSDEIARRAMAIKGPILEFIDARRGGALQRLFAEAQTIICTEDSSSMISEAIWLRRPAVGVSPSRSSFAEREGWYRNHLAANGWIRSIPIAELSPERFVAALTEIKPLAGNPLDHLAAILKDSVPTLLESA